MKRQLIMVEPEAELVKRLMLKDVFNDEDRLSLVLDIYKIINDDLYFALVWRLEFYRIQPTFPQRDGVPAHDSSDEAVLVEESILHKWEDMESSVQDAIRRACKEIGDHLSRQTD